VNLSTKIKSLNLINPTILASGIMDEDAGSMIRSLKSGASAVVTKSIGRGFQILVLIIIRMK
jgi:dihydroorotate dehydrogenase (NAD+) catalytic subunit